MDYTYVEYFNYYLKEFLNKIILNYPDVKKDVLLNYRPLLEGTMDKSDIYAKYFYSKINNDLDKIAGRDDIIFKEKGVFYLQGIDMHYLWHIATTSPAMKLSIWKYLNTLMVIGRRLIPEHREILTILKDINDGNVSIPARVNQSMADDNDDNEDTDNSAFGLENLLNMASSAGNLSSALNNFNIGELFNTVSGAFNEQFNENNAGDASVPTDAPATDAPATDAPATDNDLPDFMNAGLFAEFRDDIIALIESMGIDPKKDNNMGEMMKKLMNKGNLTRMMQLFTKMSNKIKSEVNQGELLAQLMDFIKNNGDPQWAPIITQLMNFMGNMSNVNNQHSNDNNPTRARLQRKLRNKNKH